MYRWIDETYIKPVFETQSDKAEWFGYYNYDLMSRDGKKFLCNRASFDARGITADDTLDLGWYDLESGEWHYIATTDSFNWEQGAMLQWLPGEGNENKVIYNFSDKVHFYAMIHDIVTGEDRKIDFPIYGITPDGRYSISLNYERSYWCRAYHYQPVVNAEYDVQVAEDDGVFLVDLQENKVKRIVSIQDIIALDADEDFGKAKHWLEHVMIDKAGEHFVCLHRFSYGPGYLTRIVAANIDGTNLHIISDWRSATFTHTGFGKNDFVVYGSRMNSIQAAYTKQMFRVNDVAGDQSKQSVAVALKRFARRFVPRGLKDSLKKNDRGYRHYALKNGRYQLVADYYWKMFHIDGHPSLSLDEKYMITDTYPDENGNQNLVFFNTLNKKAICVATLSAGLMGNPASCDLHPKMCFHDKYVIVDTAYTGRHRMIVFEINWEAIKKSLQ